MPPRQRPAQDQSRLSGAIAQRQQQGQAVAPSGGGQMTVHAMVQSMSGEFAKALPSVMPVDTFMRLVLNELRANPKLAECTTPSLLGALMTSARLGLEPGGPLGQFYLTPRNIKVKATRDNPEHYEQQVVPIIGYKGLRDLALRSGKVSSIQSFLIREGDSFAYGSDEARGFWHEWRPDPDGDEDRDWTGVLTIAQLTGGGKPVWRHLTAKQVLSRKARGAAGDRGPWATDEEAMVRKTGIRALIPDLPSSSVLAEANRADEQVQVWRVGQHEPQPLQQLEPGANPNPQPEVETSQEGRSGGPNQG
jgi:recombination protein RecT